MIIHLAESGAMLRQIYRLHKREQAASDGDDMNIYLAGAEFIGGYIKKQQAGEDMNIYLAGTEARGKELSKLNNSIFHDANILQSFYYCDDFSEQVIIPQSKRFLLDSGAFTFMTNGGSNVDWDSYCDKYIDFINRNKVTHFFELDIDSVVGLKKVEELRERIERGTGKQSIPVFHVSRGKQYFIDMCRNYDYVAFGGLLTDGIPRKDIVKAMPWFVNTAHEHGAKIHGLGFTAIEALKTIHFDSVDSTAWISGNKFGGVYEFTGKTIVKHNKPTGSRMAQPAKLALHNFTEWVKFSKYAETHL